MLKLPQELQEQILLRIHPVDRLRTALVCRRFAELVTSPKLLADVGFSIRGTEKTAATASIVQNQRKLGSAKFTEVNLLEFDSKLWTRLGEDLCNLKLIRCDLSSRVFVRIIRQCPNLQCIELSLKEKILLDSGETVLKCNWCTYTTARLNHMERHTLSHTGEKPHCCRQCEYRCARLDALRQHERTHARTNPLTCSRCGYLAQDAEEAALHQKVHYNMCEVCGRVLHSVRALRLHQREHLWNCSFCKFNSEDAEKLAEHETMWHLDVGVSSSSDAILTCDLCEYETVRPNHLQRHALIHSGEKPHACRQCDFRCARQDALRQHERTHARTNPLTCASCGFLSEDVAEALVHQIVHYNKCAVCGSVHHSVRALRLHERKHVKCCSFCKFTSKDAEQITVHEAEEHLDIGGV
ncbi:zinc finger protein 596 [Galendromus occidentalis]|uniref:Zinc finger protein 596 n=1 Tax=Galendromus occidentalis TaxID=34638 RepID=A0AAJ6QV15_9ACAR|nr:zinc finger protein 596 [Galendromus occidentalis]